MNFIRRLSVSSLLFCLMFLAELSAQTIIKTFPFEGATRSSRIYVPPSYTPGTPAPLVFNLHGYTSNAQQQEFYSQMNDVADTAGFIVVYPDGLANTWNSGFGLTATNDVGFISILIDSMQANYNIDLSRVYSCGMSMGGFMSFYLACKLDSRIAAIASVTGTFASAASATCSPSRAVPVMQVHGTLDNVVPYIGANGMLSVDQTLNWWRTHNGCTAPVVHDTLPDLVSEGSTITTQYYGGCNDSVEVLHFKVANGSHSWPGAPPVVPGITNQDIEGSLEIWKFFSKYSHPAPLAVSTVQPQAAEFPAFYPQPAADQVQLPAATFGYSVRVTDLTGKLMGRWTAEAQQELTLGTSQWPGGIYLAHFTAEGREMVKKLIVQ